MWGGTRGGGRRVLPRPSLLTDGTLVGFAEPALQGRVDVFGAIGHWFGRYAKRGVRHGEPFEGAGMKSMQFVRTGDGWRISAAAWDDDRPGVGPDAHRSGQMVV